MSDTESLPPIEHITQNYVPLKSLILAVSERCGKELANILRITENLPSDSARKEQFLKFVVACRQEYVKLYVLCKWAVVSGDISKAIDVANWLHGQVNCFNNVVGALFHLQAGLGPAKSPWADIETALEILKYGGPTPSVDAKVHIPTAQLSNKAVLKILRRLDILISMRLALHEKLPVPYRSYTVSNGRARFYIPHSPLWVELSIADEDVATQCRFFYVECGVLDDTSEESESSEPETSGLDTSIKAKLESVLNTQLATGSLVDALDWLSQFAAIYSLQLLDRQLKIAEHGAGPWVGVVSHKSAPTSLTITCFIGTSFPGEVTVSVSSKTPHSLVMEYGSNVSGVHETIDTSGFDLCGSTKDLGLRLLSHITHVHAAHIMQNIKAPWISKASDHSLLVELAPSKFADLSIDTTSGKFALVGNGPLVAATQEKLNSGALPLDTLSKLRGKIYLDTVAKRAQAVGWRAHHIVRLAPDELAKIAPATQMLALKLHDDKSGWSLCVAFESKKSRWFASRLECNQRRWLLGPMHDVKSSLNLLDPDYGCFVELTTIYSKQFVLYELMRELTNANVKHELKLHNGQNTVIVDITTILPGASKWAQSGLICTVQDGKISMEGRARQKHLQGLGCITETMGISTIFIDGSDGKFVVSTEQDGSGQQLRRLINAFEFLHHAAKSLASAASLGLEVLSATLSSLEIKYVAPRGIFSVQNGAKIVFDETNPQKQLAPFLPAVGEHSKSSLGKIVKFLRDCNPLWETLIELQASLKATTNTPLVFLPQSMNRLRIQLGYDLQGEYLEVTLRYFQRTKSVNFVTAAQGAENRRIVVQYFTQPNYEGVVPLVTGCAIDIGYESVLRDILETIAQEKSQEAQDDGLF